MKQRLLCLILCAAMLLSMVGCTQTTPQETTAPSTVPSTAAPTEPVPGDIYAAARDSLDQASHLSLDVVISTLTQVGGDEFTQTSTQILTYQDLGTEECVILCQEDVEFYFVGEVYEEFETPSFREIWYKGNLYAEMDSTHRFYGPMEQDAALGRYLPAVLLDAALYGEITAVPNGNDTLLTFASPAAAESWAVPEDGELLEASGSALITDQGALAEMSYTVTYQYGPAKITKTVQSKPMATPKTVAPPADPEAYSPLTHVDALRMAAVSPMLLLQAGSATVTDVESLFCQAAGVLRNQSMAMNLHGRESDIMAKVETNVYFMDYTSMEDVKYKLEETYIDGTLTTVEDNGLPTGTAMDWETIWTFTTDGMGNGQIPAHYWDDVTLTDMGSILYLEYTLNENFGNTIQNSICEMLWDDPNFLLDLADDYRNEELTGYLSIDKYTGLPVAAGYYYKGIHTLDGMDYPLTLQYDQSIAAPAKGAYQEITDQLPEEAEPEGKPTPLFYHVTGENGQEMWLLGTIHVGDERTAYLPKEIYNAFAASDALALECDTEAFEDQLEEDDALSDQVSAAYFYSDGTTVERLLEEEEYAQAVKLLKATGCYNMNMPYAKPYLWSNSIEQFYLRQGYQLHGDQGIEERLHDWAEELDMEIREIESNLFQLHMLTGFSNDLQIELLRDVLESDGREYWESVTELYDLWCAGDEAALREKLSDEVDFTDMTEEEIAEYEDQKHLIEEYNKAMSYDRNDGMLEVAIEYLESGEVVFYAVGLAHLLNNVNGLVDTLREAGYTVELVPYA